MRNPEIGLPRTRGLSGPSGAGSVGRIPPWLRWWARRDLPRAARLLRARGLHDDEAWAGAGDGECRGRWHGYRLRLDLSHLHQRGAWCYGRLFDMPVQLCLMHGLRPGDVVLDGGAHVGMTAMLAAWRAGPSGRVLAFEPNPEIYRRLRWHVDRNGLEQVSTFPFALSAGEGRAVLRVPTTLNSGAATLGALVPRQRGPRVVEHEIELRVGDEVIEGLELPDRPMFVKLDVEGHEHALLSGLRRTLEARGPAVLLECNVEMLPQNGASVEGLFELLEGLGYETLIPTVRWWRWARWFELRLHRAAPGWRPLQSRDLLFVRPGAEHHRRLSRYLVHR